MNQSSVGLSSAYRPDIDGLRSVAVVPVVLFHAGLGLTGGYVGVDVFFVISGFLITGIIAREIGETRFSLLEFYRRRARRIFPALAAMVLTTLVAGYFILTPTDFVDLGKSAASISVFGSNFYFWKSVSYFDPGIQPLLHTWSLAVEEQYYIFFPLLLVVLHGNRTWMVRVLWAILIGSLALSIVMVAWKPSAAFYLLPTRAWELMLGGLLALGCFADPTSRTTSRAATVGGLALIIVPIFAYTPTTPFPGLAAIPPSTGAALIIWAKDDSWLSNSAAVQIGKLSYSLYLWHLPIIEFAKYLSDGELTFAAGLAASAVSLVIAYASLVWIEAPFRRSKPRERANRLALAAASAMPILAAASIAVVMTGGMPQRFTPAVAKQLAVADDRERHHVGCMSLDEKYVEPGRACRLGADVAPSALLWGDSHAMVSATAAEEAARRAGQSLLFAANADCPIGIGFGIDPSVASGLSRQGHYRRCADYNRAMLDVALASPGIRTVILSSRWTNWRIGEPSNPAEAPADLRLRDQAGTATSVDANRAKFERGFTLLVSRLADAGKTVAIVGPLPEPVYNVPHRLYVSRFGLAEAPQPISIADYQRRHSSILAFFKRFESQPSVVFIWPSSILCGQGTCATVEQGMPKYFDHNHLTVSAARATAPLYAPLFAGPH